MSGAYLTGSPEYLPPAEITFDRYHVRTHLSKAIDEIRRAEAKQHKQLLKNTRYLWLKRPANLTARQQDLLDEFFISHLTPSAPTSSRCASTTSTSSTIPTLPRSTCAAGSPRSSPAACGR